MLIRSTKPPAHQGITEEVKRSHMSGTESSAFGSAAEDSEDALSGSSSDDSPSKRQPKNPKAPKAKAPMKPAKGAAKGTAAKSAAAPSKPPRGKKPADIPAPASKFVPGEGHGPKLNLPPPKRIGLSRRDRVEQLHPS
jgi:hypothetical protein